MRSNTAINLAGLMLFLLAIAIGSHLLTQAITADRSVETRSFPVARDSTTAVVTTGDDKERTNLDHAELLIIYIGSSTCPFSRPGEVKPLVEALVAAVRKESLRRQKPAAAVGVAVSHPASDGVRYLEEVGAFDIMIAGRGWRDEEMGEIVAEHVEQRVATPTIVLLERVRASPMGGMDNMESEDELVLRVRTAGLFDLQRWVAQGSFLPPVPDVR